MRRSDLSFFIAELLKKRPPPLTDVTGREAGPKPDYGF